MHFNKKLNFLIDIFRALVSILPLQIMQKFHQNSRVRAERRRHGVIKLIEPRGLCIWIVEWRHDLLKRIDKGKILY